MRGVTLFSLLNKIYHTKEQEKSDRRYFQWEIAHVTVKFFGSLSYSCYFSVAHGNRGCGCNCGCNTGC